MKIYDYTTAGGKNLILAYIHELTEDLRAIVYQIREDISKYGIDAFVSLQTRQLIGKLWEIKFKNQRIMYVIIDRDAVYFLHICRKQKNKAERKDIETAVKRAGEYGIRL